MKEKSDLWLKLCSYDNLLEAFKKARKHKTQKSDVKAFEKNLKNNLLTLRTELLFHVYQPRPLTTFIINDPKTRKISKSEFRDRVVHHALCNIIEPLFDNSFIFDSYANRKGKGTLKAIERFDIFKRKISRNNTKKCYVLKADIKKYFENVDHNILIEILKRKITGTKIIWLIRKILSNYYTKLGKGMPLGNLTSQFFANVYLNELDQFVKHKLQAKYYLRYVDDFVILHDNFQVLKSWKLVIDLFLKEILCLELHQNKSKMILLGRKLQFLGVRVFPYHKLMKQSNMRKMQMKLHLLKKKYAEKKITYDAIYDFFEGWFAYTRYANTYKRRVAIGQTIEATFPNEISAKEIMRLEKCLLALKKSKS